MLWFKVQSQRGSEFYVVHCRLSAPPRGRTIPTGAVGLESLRETSQAAAVTGRHNAIAIPPAASEPLRFAASELQRYLAAITGRALPIITAAAPANSLHLGSADMPALEPLPGPDSFIVLPTSDGAVIQGQTPRAVLHAVYCLLEQFGCCWSLHSRNEEVVPRLDTLPAIQSIPSAPRYAVRGYAADIMTWHYGDSAQFAEHLAADYEFVDWMGKSAANAYLFIRHPFDSQLTVPELIPDFTRRGISVEYGGHVIPLLLPREIFKDHPEFFPQRRNGERTEYGNLCTANATALRIASENAVHYVREHPELSVLHIWGADLWEGGWCHCSQCVGVTVQDQSLRLCNAVSEALGAEGVTRPVCYLAYHDTIDPDLHERPAPGVWVEYAPRERCYGHALDDSNCRTNRRYRESLERYVELFDGRVRIFEYYADAILFCGCAVPLAEVIAADLDYFHRLGIREITNLQFGAFSLWAYPANFLAYAAATRASGCDVAQLRSGYAQRFGTHATLMVTTLAELELIMRNVVTFGDIRRPPTKADAVQRLRPRVAAATTQLAVLVDRLASVAGDPAMAAQPMAAQHGLLRYTNAVLAGVLHQLDNLPAAADYEMAMAIMRDIDRRFTGLWGAVNLPVIHAYHSHAYAHAYDAHANHAHELNTP